MNTKSALEARRKLLNSRLRSSSPPSSHLTLPRINYDLTNLVLFSSQYSKNYVPSIMLDLWVEQSPVSKQYPVTSLFRFVVNPRQRFLARAWPSYCPKPSTFPHTFPTAQSSAQYCTEIRCAELCAVAQSSAQLRVQNFKNKICMKYHSWNYLDTLGGLLRFLDRFWRIFRLILKIFRPILQILILKFWARWNPLRRVLRRTENCAELCAVSLRNCAENNLCAGKKRMRFRTKTPRTESLGTNVTGVSVPKG